MRARLQHVQGLTKTAAISLSPRGHLIIFFLTGMRLRHGVLQRNAKGEKFERSYA